MHVKSLDLVYDVWCKGTMDMYRQRNASVLQLGNFWWYSVTDKIDGHILINAYVKTYV